MPGMELRALLILFSHSIITVILEGCVISPFAYEEIEVQMYLVICPESVKSQQSKPVHH